ncbi:MAG TPA: GNAT family protein [Bryobacteraceae bacterium]|nr:GNAT family protein [Bryobacteraceae bacterium]
MAAELLDPSIDSTPAPRPERTTLRGRHITVAPLDAARDALPLWQGASGVTNAHLWTYLSDGPFQDRETFDAHLRTKAASEDPLFFALLDAHSGRALGHAAYMRIAPEHRCIEIGNILYTPALQQTIAATEAMYLMARHAFEDLGYRRYEWKCNALNEPSRRAALRLGFHFEGISRQHMIVKGRNRDTAWFSMLDREWPARKANFERWLDPSNFYANGKQRLSLSELMAVEV